MLSLQQRVSAIVRKELHPLLAAEGYRKQGRTYRREDAGHVRVLSINSSGRVVEGVGLVGSFGVEIGIHFPGAFAIGHPDADLGIRIHECTVFSGLPVDGWGHFDDPLGIGMDLDSQAEALARAWREYGKPWLDDHADPSTALEWARFREDWKEALNLAIDLGEMEAAAECLARCREIEGGQWLDFIENLATRHAVPGVRPGA